MSLATVQSMKTAFETAVQLAKLSGKVTPHTLRYYLAATWLMRAGVDKCEAVGFLGMSVETLDRVYGHPPAGGRAFHWLPAEGKIGYSIGWNATGRSTHRRIPQPIEIIGGPGKTR